MKKTGISEQADKYADVIVGQIKSNFCEVARQIDACEGLKNAIDEYNKTVNQSTISKFFFERNLDEYKRHLDKEKDANSQYVCDQYNTVEPLAVGLFGEWGSGKTHQLKLIKNKLLFPVEVEESKKVLCMDTEDKEIEVPKIIPVFFNAWRFEKEEHIIIPLFQTLLQAVEDQEFQIGQASSKIYKTLSMYLKFGLLSLKKGLKKPDLVSAVKEFDHGEYKKAIDAIIDTSKIITATEEKVNEEIVGEQKLSELIKPDILESIYLNIPQWIEKITLFENVNFVFLIDDLDRCLPENTLKMLESIKLFLDVPSCAFVLAVDDDVVERGVVHHYRDYLQQNNNTVVFMDKDGVPNSEDQKSHTHELPITGHEYLEKMIQLPIRLPVIDEQNAKEFLEKHSHAWIKIVDKDYEKNLEIYEKTQEGNEPIRPSLALLDYMAKVIPAKPRKLKRVIKLFETKLELLKRTELKDKVTDMLVLKIVLLELFSPQILRYMQNNNYSTIYNALCRFQYASYRLEKDKEPKEKKELSEYKNSLVDTVTIKKFINRKGDDAYTPKEILVFEKLLKYVEEHYTSRIKFDLDDIFDEKQEPEKLKIVIETMDVKEQRILEKSMIEIDSNILQRLFRDGDVDAWRDSLSEHKSILDTKQLNALIVEAKTDKDSTFNDLPFISNPEWVGQVAKYVSDDDYKELLKASHDARFKKVEKSNFEIDMFQLTFAEYDKYCDITGEEKPKDRGWGRGRRPVIYVSWNDTKQYIEWLNVFLKDKQNNYSYALPTKEEWELACNQGQESLWHFGDKEEELEQYAWYDKNSDGKTHPVGSLKPNTAGLYDMHGNVWEWSKDWYEKEENNKALKGGSWGGLAWSARTADASRDPVSSFNNIGFRLLRTLR